MSSKVFSQQELEFISEVKIVLNQAFLGFEGIEFTLDENSFITVNNIPVNTFNTNIVERSFSKMTFSIHSPDDFFQLEVSFIVERINCELGSFIGISLFMPMYDHNIHKIPLFKSRDSLKYLYYCVLFHIIDLFAVFPSSENEYLKSSIHLKLLSFVSNKIDLPKGTI